MTAPAALDGVRVLDFGRFVAGPFCACLLGDLGADVIRIEKVDGGEDRARPRIADHEICLVFARRLPPLAGGENP